MHVLLYSVMLWLHHCLFPFMWCIYPNPSGLLHWHWGNHMIAPEPVKQPWRIGIKSTHTNPPGKTIYTAQPCHVYISWKSTFHVLTPVNLCRQTWGAPKHFSWQSSYHEKILHISVLIVFVSRPSGSIIFLLHYNIAASSHVTLIWCSFQQQA